MVSAKHSIPLHLYILMLKYGTDIYKLVDNKPLVSGMSAAEQVLEVLTYWTKALM